MLGLCACVQEWMGEGNNLFKSINSLTRSILVALVDAAAAVVVVNLIVSVSVTRIIQFVSMRVSECKRDK